MSEQQTKRDESVTPEAPTGGHLMVDLGPVLLFVLTYNIAGRMDHDNAVYWATGIFIVATLAAIAYARLVQKRAAPMLLFTGAVVLVFGGLTFILRDPTFIKLKPTIIYLFYAAIIFGGFLFGRNLWKSLFAGTLTLPDRIWKILAIRWGLFFVFMAGVNEIVWRNFSEAFWANFKLFGFFPLLILFGLVNAPLTMKHQGKTEELPPLPPPE